MTDLEMTSVQVSQIVYNFINRGTVPNDEQAMALAKKLDLVITKWGAKLTVYQSGKSNRKWRAQNPDLNRAIVECVAKMSNPLVTKSSING